MKKKLLLYSCLLAAISIILTAALINITVYRDFNANMHESVQLNAANISQAYDTFGLDYLETVEGDSSTYRVTLVSPGGEVLFDTAADAESLANHADRPEISAALTAGSGESTRYSETLSRETYYYALQQVDGNILRVAMTIDSVYASLLAMLPLMLLIAVVVFVLSLLFASWQSKRIIKPINELDLDHPADNDIYSELAPLLLRLQKQNEMIAGQMTQLRQAQNEFAEITNHMREGFLVIDDKEEVLSYNKSALLLLDIAAIGEGPQHILSFNRSESLRETLDRVLAGESAECLLEVAERKVRLLANPVIDNGRVQGAVLLLRDTTEQEEREKLRREFTANVSHELKTPLTSISGYAEIIANGLARPEDVQRFAGNIYDEVQRLISLINDIIKLSRLDEAEDLPQRQQIDLAELVTTVCERLEPEASRQEIAFDLQLTPCSIFGVGQIIEEMVYNLVDNAIKYNRRQGRVTVQLADQGAETILTVSDTGIGIPEAEQERVFERFYRVDKSHSDAVPGTGLGLSIVKHGAMVHHAKITVHSQVGQGTSVEIRFPH